MYRLTERIYNNMTDGYCFDEKKIEWIESDVHVFTLQEYTYAYDGEVKNHKRHGKGICKCSSRDKYNAEYNGEWKNDKMYGKGKLTWNKNNWYGRNLYSYDGEWIDNKPHGEGTYTDGYGNIYEGNWYYGEKYGYGIWTTINGDKYKEHAINGDKYKEHAINGDKYKEQFGRKISKRVRSLILPNSLLRYNDYNDEFSKIKININLFANSYRNNYNDIYFPLYGGQIPLNQYQNQHPNQNYPNQNYPNQYQNQHPNQNYPNQYYPNQYPIPNQFNPNQYPIPNTTRQITQNKTYQQNAHTIISVCNDKKDSNEDDRNR